MNKTTDNLDFDSAYLWDILWITDPLDRLTLSFKMTTEQLGHARTLKGENGSYALNHIFDGVPITRLLFDCFPVVIDDEHEDRPVVVIDTPSQQELRDAYNSMAEHTFNYSKQVRRQHAELAKVKAELEYSKRDGIITRIKRKFVGEDK